MMMVAAVAAMELAVVVMMRLYWRASLERAAVQSKSL